MAPPIIHRSIRWRLLIAMAGLGVVISTALTIIHIQSQNNLVRLATENAQSIRREMLAQRGHILAKILKERIESNLAPIQTHIISNYVNLAIMNHPDLNEVVITEDQSGIAIVSMTKPFAATNATPKSPPPMLVITEPILSGTAPWGTLRLIYSPEGLIDREDPLTRSMQATSNELISRSIHSSILLLAIGIGIVLVVSSRLADPIIQLTESVQEIARGHFSAARNINTQTHDEIGTLSRAFVKMTDDLQASYSELKRTAEEARRAGTFLDRVLDNLPHIVFVKDARDLKFVLINRAGEDLLKTPRDALIGMSDLDLFGPEQADIYFKRDRHILASGKEMELPEGVMNTPDGQRRYIRTRLIPITEADGAPRYLLGIAEDITTQKSAAEERRLFFNHSLDLMCIANLDGTFEQVNPAFVSTLGYSAEELCSRPYFDFVHPDDIDGTIAAAAKLYEGEIVVSFQNRYICRDGSIRWLTWNAGIDREFKKVYAVARDTTEQRDTEERIFQAGVKEQERIARDLHDGLGQILTALAFKGKLIEQMLQAGEALTIKQATDIVTLANRASEQARALARGLDPVVMKEGLVMALHDLAHTTTESFGIACTVEHDDASESLDKNLANHLFRIAQEAVNNAVKHGMSTSISIYVTTDDEATTLTVLNDGIIVTTAHREDTGLGIHTMNHRAKLIGGALNIIPNPTGGLIVRCTVRTKAPPIPDQHFSTRNAI